MPVPCFFFQPDRTGFYSQNLFCRTGYILELGQIQYRYWNQKH